MLHISLVKTFLSFSIKENTINAEFTIVLRNQIIFAEFNVGVRNFVSNDCKKNTVSLVKTPSFCTSVIDGTSISTNFWKKLNCLKLIMIVSLYNKLNSLMFNIIYYLIIIC